MDVYLLYHIGHQNEAGPDDSTVHYDSEGDIHLDELDGDDVKLLGVYSTRELAEERVKSARLLPGFSAEPECFTISRHTLDRDQWREGFIRVPPDEG